MGDRWGAAFVRIGWQASFGLGGSFAPDWVAGITGIRMEVAPRLLRVAPPAPQGPSGRCAGGASHHTAVWRPRAWPLRPAPSHAWVGARRTAGEPAPPGPLPGASGLARQAPAPRPSAEDRRAGADGGADAAPPRVDGASTTHRGRWRHDVSPSGCRRGVSRWRPGCGRACRGRVVQS